MSDRSEYRLNVQKGDIVETSSGQLAVVKKIKIFNGGNTKIAFIWPLYIGWAVRIFRALLNMNEYSDSKINTLTRLGTIINLSPSSASVPVKNENADILDLWQQTVTNSHWAMIEALSPRQRIDFLRRVYLRFLNEDWHEGSMLDCAVLDALRDLEEEFNQTPT